MGSYTFKWEHPEASEVFVTGTFDDWGKTQKLNKLPTGFFEKTVSLPDKTKILYKFVVDGNWTTNTHLPIEKDSSGNENNVLQESEIIHPSEAAISTVGAGATTAALAGAVPKESEKSVAAPGAFPETPAAEPETFSVNPIPATAGAGNPVTLKPGEPVPDPSTLTSNTISSTAKDDPELKAAAAEPSFSVNPIPATAGAGNPVTLAPGEPIPDPSTLTGNTVQSTVKTDEASYNASDAVAPAVAAAGATSAKEAEVNPQETGAFGVPPATGTMIPESSMPVGAGAATVPDEGPGAGILTSSVGAGATTAALAAQVPKEPRGVPEVVSESQGEANVPPEASANPTAVEEKKEMEEELKAKVPEEPPAAESGLPTGKIAAAVGGAVAAAGATAAVVTERAKNVATDASTAASGMVSGTPAPTAPAEEGVPEVVKESITEAHVSPEAAGNPEAVKEKEAMEAELESKIKPTEESGEPAPTVTAATTEKAPEPTAAEAASALNAPASTPAVTETTATSVKPEIADVAAEPTNGTPATTTGVATESTPAKSEAGPATPSKTETPTETSKADKKKKRRSVFIDKLKKIFD